MEGVRTGSPKLNQTFNSQARITCAGPNQMGFAASEIPLATAVNVSATNNADIDGLLSGYKWSGTITYSFPDSPSDYANLYSGGSSEPTTWGFASAPSQMQAAINYAIGLILGYTNASIQYAGANGADIMVAQSPAANPTSYAYYPGNYASGGGRVVRNCLQLFTGCARQLLFHDCAARARP